MINVILIIKKGGKKQMREKNERFGFRKLSIGLASVCIGATLFGIDLNTVKADTIDSSTSSQVANATDYKTTNDVDTNEVTTPSSSAIQTQSEKQKVTTTAGTSNKTNLSDDTNKVTSDAPAFSKKADKSRPSEVKVTNTLTSSSDNTSEVTTPTNTAPVKPATKEQKNKATTTMATNSLGKHNVAGFTPNITNKTLAGSKVAAKFTAMQLAVQNIPDTNGGFDEATWGKLDVSKWTIKTLTDADVKDTLAKSGNLELTAYNGDEQHIIIPNLLDIYNAGKADSAMVGNSANEDSTKVVISKDLLRQFSENATSIAFSKTHTDHISNKDVNQMSNLTKTGIDHLTKVYSKNSDLSLAFSHLNDSGEIESDDIPKAKLDVTNFDVSNVTNMRGIFAYSDYDGLSTIADWDTSNVTDMWGMFFNANLSDLEFLSHWNTSNVTDMNRMFEDNPLLTNLVPIAGWDTSNVTDMISMFPGSPVTYADLSKWDFSKIAQYVPQYGGAPGLYAFLVNADMYGNVVDNPSYKTIYLGNNETLPSWVLTNNSDSEEPDYNIFRANDLADKHVLITSDPRLLANSNGAYNHLTFTDDTGKQTKVDIPMAISTENATGDFASVKQRVIDFVNAEAAKQPAPTGKKWVITNTDLNDPVKIANANFLLYDSTLSVLNTNDAYALDEKNGLHEHINVNDNGGYDKDYWGTIDLNNWNYEQNNAGDITLSGYKGSNNTKIIIPNIADFAHGNVTQTITLQVNPNVDTNKVSISSSVMHDLAKNATRIGLSKTANKKVVAEDDIWQNAFGGLTNKPGTTDNAYGGIKYGSPNLTQMDLHNLDTASITNMSALFNGGSNLTTVGDLSEWNTSNVTNMNNMFQTASSLTNIGNLDNWDTSNVTDMTGMFNQTMSLSNIGDLSKWQTGNVTNMSWMFNNAPHLTNIGDLSKWQTSNVTDMHNMFANATSLTNIGNLDNWDTNKVTDMSWMFGTDSGKQSHLTNIGDLSKWQTGNVTDMRSMFQTASSLTNIGNLDNWDTNKVTNMNWMFANTTSLTNIGDLSKWQTGNVTDMHNMFTNATSLTNIGNLDNWDTNKVTDMSWMFGTDSGKQSHLTNIGDLSKWQTGNVTDMRSMFQTASSLTNIGNLDNWDTNKVTNMNWMFANTTSLTNIGDLSKWQTGNVTDMHYMFFNATSLTNIGNLDNWDTNKVTDMHWMFGVDYSKQSHLTHIGDLSKWDTSHVTDMNSMFANKALLHLNISNWNLTKLANKDAMKFMFANATNLTVIANNLKLPTWYQNEVNDADSFWNNHIAVITNVPELIRATGDINNLKIDKQDASRSIFYDSKGSSDAIKVLTDANNQYIADYNKANPTKVLKLADTVDRNDPISLANASFVTEPKEFNLTVHFEDIDSNADKDSDTVKQELAKTVELSGHNGDIADLSQVQLPTNFELSGNLPSATFGDTDSVTIQLKHKLSDDIHQEANGMASASTNVIAPDGTLLIHGEVGIASLIDQRQDLVTGQMVNGDTHWQFQGYSQTNVSSDILDKYIEQYNPVIINTYSGHSTEGWQYALGGLSQPLQIKLKAGYTSDANPEVWHDWNNNGTYTWVGLRNAHTGSGLQGASDWDAVQQLNSFYPDVVHIVPLDQSVHYQFMDNGTQVGSDVTLTGKTDETVSTNLSIPENYELTDGTTLPTSYTFDAINPTIQINLKHKTETSVESLPATRTIILHLPGNETQTIVQTINYTRNKHHDLVTNKDTYDDYVFDATKSFTMVNDEKSDAAAYSLNDGQAYFATYKLPKIPGYTAKMETATPMMMSFMYIPMANFIPAVVPELTVNLSQQKHIDSKDTANGEANKGAFDDTNSSVTKGASDNTNSNATNGIHDYANSDVTNGTHGDINNDVTNVTPNSTNNSNTTNVTSSDTPANDLPDNTSSDVTTVSTEDTTNKAPSDIGSNTDNKASDRISSDTADSNVNNDNVGIKSTKLNVDTPDAVQKPLAFNTARHNVSNKQHSSDHLPQTGANTTTEIFGSIASILGVIGLAGTKKRKKEQ